MVDYLRKSSEALILLVLILAPWAFGGVHPISKNFITMGLGLVMVFWAIELLISPRPIFTRFQLPIATLALLAGLQLIPMGRVAALLSPVGAKMKSDMFPQEPEVLADGTTFQVPFWTARGRTSVYPAATLNRAYWLVLMGLLFTRVQDLANVNTLRRLCFACLVNGCVLSYFSVFQHFMAERNLIYGKFPSLGAAFGPFVNRNHFAFYINICFGLSLGLVGSRLMGRVKSFRLHDLVEAVKDSLSLWMVSVLVFMPGAVILCSSRGGMISLLGGTLITSAFVAATGSFHQSWKWFLLAACIFGLAAGVQTWLGFDFVDSRYAMHNDSRTSLWLPLLRLIPQFPLTGTGLGTLAYVEPFTRFSSARPDTFVENAHNEYLQLVLELGIPGLLCGLALLAMLITKIGHRVRSSRHNAWLYVGALFGLCTITLHSFVEFFATAIPAVAVLTTVLLGHVAGLGHVKPKPLPSSAYLVRGFAIVMLVFTYCAVREARRDDTADRYWRIGKRAFDEGNIDATLQQWLNAQAYVPNNAEYLLDTVRIQFSPNRAELLEDKQELLWAQRDLLRARELCPLASETHFFLGQAAHTFAQADSDLTYYDRALLARPLDQQLWYITGRTYLKRGDVDNAARHFQRSLAIAPDYADEILDLSIDHMDSETVGSKVLPSELPALLAAGDWFARRGKMDTAQQIRRRALETPDMNEPDSGDLFYQKAELLRVLGAFDDAITSYKVALNYEPDQITWRLRLATVLGGQGEYQEADGQIQRALQSRPGYGPAIRLRETLRKSRQAIEQPDP